MFLESRQHLEQESSLEDQELVACVNSWDAWGLGPRSRGSGSPAAWEGREAAFMGAWETLFLLGHRQGWEVRAMGAL